MNKRLFYFIIAISLLYLTACKKDTATIPPVPKYANTPTCAYMSYENIGGTWAYYLSLFDLSSPQTMDKKYFKMQLKFVGVKDSFEMVVPPQSINNLASNFPAEITEYPGYGLVNQWTNPQYRLLSSGGGYYKDTIVRNPQSNYYHYYLNFLGGGLAGKWPQSNFDNYRVPTGVNAQNTLHFRTIFYFKEGLCYDANNAEPTETIKSISSFYKAAPNYDWKNVNAGLQISGGGVSRFYFLDFKNWRYFKWEQFMNNIFSPAQLATTFDGYQTLDNFIKWPDGWGKK
jgi:hypothetical protein